MDPLTVFPELMIRDLGRVCSSEFPLGLENLYGSAEVFRFDCIPEDLE